MACIFSVNYTITLTYSNLASLCYCLLVFLRIFPSITFSKRTACTKTRNTGTPRKTGTLRNSRKSPEHRIKIDGVVLFTDHAKNEMSVLFVYPRRQYKIRYYVLDGFKLSTFFAWSLFTHYRPHNIIWRKNYPFIFTRLFEKFSRL